MKNLIALMSITAILLFACSATKTKAPECGDVMCTLDFRMIQVTFKDAAGNPIVVQEFSAINQRTGESTVQNNEPATPNNKGIYTVASDADVKNLSDAGDVILVTATNPANNKKTSTEFVVAGGTCACHVIKKSGPSEITL